MSNSLDSDQARRIVGPDLGPNCLPKLSADDTGRQRVKQFEIPGSDGAIRVRVSKPMIMRNTVEQDICEEISRLSKGVQKVFHLQIGLLPFGYKMWRSNKFSLYPCSNH